MTIGAFAENYEQDKNGRSARVMQTLGGQTYTKRFGYYKQGDHATNRVNTIYYSKNGVSDGKVIYTYDGMGNIVSVNENGKQHYKYAYDKIGRLISEKDVDKNREICYTYDENGNIQTKIQNGTITNYRYKDGTDRLMNYGSEEFAYDNLGNPTTYRNMPCEWEKGRQLKSITDGTNTVTFTYDEFGERISKTAGGITTNYVYENGKLLREITGSEKIDFIYGAEGIIGIRIGNENYLYRKNVYGDVTEIYDASGVKVGKYKYTAFGECEVEMNTNGIAEKNPIRYRGYYYDTETSLYYLKTRYYDPEVGRFMTIDGIEYLDPETINGLNLYAYCGNNPVMNIDPSGNFFLTFLLVSIGIGFAVGGAMAGVTAYRNGARGWDLVGSIVGGAILGGGMGAIMAIGGAAGLASIGAGLTGFSLSAGAAFGVSLAVGAGAGLLSYTAKTLISPSKQWSWVDFGVNGLSGLIKGAATYWIAFMGARFGAFDKVFLKDLLGKELVKDIFSYDIAKGMLASIIPSAGRQFFTQVAYYWGESLTKMLLVSSVASGARWIIDKIFGT